MKAITFLASDPSALTVSNLGKKNKKKETKAQTNQQKKHEVFLCKDSFTRSVWVEVNFLQNRKSCWGRGAS